MTDFRALCVDLLEEINSMWERSQWREVNMDDDLINRTIDALAEPLPEPPTLPEPVPIVERLPGPDDLNEDGQCWWYGEGADMIGWTFDAEGASYYRAKFWLPANAIPTPTVKESLTDQTEELPMAEPLLEGNLTMPTMGINAACVSRNLPEAVRLVTTEDHNGNTIYKLQGVFAWRQGAEFGGEWRLLETQDELFAKDTIPYGLLP